MKNNILLPSLKNRACTGCSMCGGICPTNAINIELTRDGFYEPSINNDLCIGCSLCKKVCYKFDEEIKESNEEEYSSYSAINNNNEELATATSGGVSIELMKECIKQGYKVVGVSYDYDKDIAVTEIVSEISELNQFKGSKYFQSYTYSAFNEILKDKTEQRYAIFGTPCQIYALSRVCEIKKNRDRFIFVDLFCHGCPSINLWKKYLENIKEKFSVSKFNNIEFRSKVHGWHEFGFKFFKENTQYKSKKLNDPFYELFFDMNSHNKACYKCRMRSSLAYTDIRMGDFWGYQYDSNTKGVSAVILASKKGKNLFSKVEKNFTIKSHTIKETVAAQSYGKPHFYEENIRKETIELLSSDKNINQIIKIYRSKYSIKKKVKILFKNLVKCLPKAIYFRLKKLIHSF